MRVACSGCRTGLWLRGPGGIVAVMGRVASPASVERELICGVGKLCDLARSQYGNNPRWRKRSYGYCATLTDALLAAGMLTWTRVALAENVGGRADGELGREIGDDEGRPSKRRGPGYGNRGMAQVNCYCNWESLRRLWDDPLIIGWDDNCNTPDSPGGLQCVTVTCVGSCR